MTLGFGGKRGGGSDSLGSAFSDGYVWHSRCSRAKSLGTLGALASFISLFTICPLARADFELVQLARPKIGGSSGGGAGHPSDLTSGGSGGGSGAASGFLSPENMSNESGGNSGAFNSGRHGYYLNDADGSLQTFGALGEGSVTSLSQGGLDASGDNSGTGDLSGLGKTYSGSSWFGANNGSGARGNKPPSIFDGPGIAARNTIGPFQNLMKDLGFGGSPHGGPNGGSGGSGSPGSSSGSSSNSDGGASSGSGGSGGWSGDGNGAGGSSGGGSDPSYSDGSNGGNTIWGNGPDWINYPDTGGWNSSNGGTGGSGGTNGPNVQTFSVDDPLTGDPPAPVPEPASILLVAIVLAGWGALRRPFAPRM